MTRDLDQAKDYFGVRYAEAPEARYGLVASSRDKILAEWGIPNDYQSTKVMRLGPWYGDGEESHRSCRHLRECVTEFGAQGLELDGVLLAWGTDLVWRGRGGRRRRRRSRRLVQRARQAPCALRARARPLPAARQRLPRAAHPRARRGGHLRPADPRARRHRRAAAGARGEGALSRVRAARCDAQIVTLCAARRPAYHRGMHHLFLDESGDHSLAHIDAGYPVFVLGGVLVADDSALEHIERAVAAFKRDSSETPTSCCTPRTSRGTAMASKASPTQGRVIASIAASTPCSQRSISASSPASSARLALLERHGELAVDPYMLSLGIVVERFCFELGGSGPQGRILVERRNERLDHELTIAWDVLRLNGTRYVQPEVLRRRIAGFEFATKATGGAGLEIADLVVTPLGRWVAGMPPKPDLDIVRSKLRRGPKGDWEGAGLVVLPKESGRGPLRNTRPLPE